MTLRRHGREISVALALLGLLLLLAVVAPAFFTAANLRDLLVGNAPALVAARAMQARMERRAMNRRQDSEGRDRAHSKRTRPIARARHSAEWARLLR